MSTNTRRASTQPDVPDEKEAQNYETDLHRKDVSSGQQDRLVNDVMDRELERSVAGF